MMHAMFFLTALLTWLSAAAAFPFHEDCDTLDTLCGITTEAVSDKVMSLYRTQGLSPSSNHLQSKTQLQIGNSPLNDTYYGEVYLTEIVFGDEIFKVVVDTGSSDTWLAKTGFICFSVDDLNLTLAEAECGFGSTYNQTSTFESIPDENLSIIYGDLEQISGTLGYEDVTLAGIKVLHQEVGIVDMASWDGDNITSGILGLAYPNLTSAFIGTNSSLDNSSTIRYYSPIFTTMYRQNYIQAVFSLAISRDKSGTGNGGVMAFGGIPSNVQGDFSSTFASTPLVIFSGNAANGFAGYTFYTIAIDGISFRGCNTTAEDEVHNNSDVQMPIVNGTASLQMVIDSGTSVNILPTNISTAFNALFSPPAFRDPSGSGSWFIYCNASAPEFNVHIGGQAFPLNRLDLIQNDLVNDTGVCFSAVQDGGMALGPPMILGSPFLRNVLAVFDVGTETFRVASRVDYPS